MTARVFIDTNILLYCYDRSDAHKRGRASEVVDAVASVEAGALSTQVLGEFFVNATRKLRPSLSLEDAETRLAHFLDAWTILDLTGTVVREAVRGVRQHRLSFWDAQIWAAAFVNRVPVVLSEDFSDGSNLDGVRFLNPLRPAFRLADWV